MSDSERLRIVRGQLDELRRFRHLFRNLYKSQLKPNRVREVSDLVNPLIKRFTPCHHRFLAWIDELLATEAREADGPQ
jgi:hypothetical protein